MRCSAKPTIFSARLADLDGSKIQIFNFLMSRFFGLSKSVAVSVRGKDGCPRAHGAMSWRS